MKYYLILAITLIFSLSRTYSQIIVGKSYVTTVENIKVYPVDPPYNNGKYFYYVHRNTKFTVISIDNSTNNVVVTFWAYSKVKDSSKFKRNLDSLPNILSKDAKEFSAFNNTHKDQRVHGPSRNSIDVENIDDDLYIGPWAGTRSFIMPLTAFNSQTHEYFGKSTRFTWGAMTLPIKLRFGNKEEKYFNFEERVNLGFSAGAKFQIPSRFDQSICLLGGFGIASVKTDSVSLKEGYYDSNHLTDMAFSISIGVLYQYETFQIGLFTGLDHIGSTLGRQWKYQGKPWIGLAIGISLFNRSNTSATVPGSNSD